MAKRRGSSQGAPYQKPKLKRDSYRARYKDSKVAWRGSGRGGGERGEEGKRKLVKQRTRTGSTHS